jgi:PKD repeat protein
LTVAFNGGASGGGAPYTYTWDFGDGHTSNERNPTHTYQGEGSFTVRLIATDTNSKQATDSTLINVSAASTGPGFVADIVFREADGSEELTEINSGRWYDIYVYFENWDSISYSDVWISHSSSTEGSIVNRGGRFYSESNYVKSYSISTNQIWAVEVEGTSNGTNITGRLGLYVDDDNGEYEQNSSEQWAKARFRLLDNALPGTWVMQGYVKNKDGEKSSLFQKSISVVSNATGRIVGTVVDALTGQPLESVQVDFFDDAGSRVADAVTDGGGNYASGPLQEGDYFTATDSGQGYRDELFDDIPCTGCDPTTGTPITVTGGSDTVADFGLTNGEPPPVTIYGSPDGGDAEGWRIYDATPAGATINNVYDATLQSNVTELAGSGKSNGYALRNPDGGKWRNQSQFYIEWSMAYAEDFAVFVDVETSAGHRYMKYTPVDYNSLGSSTYIQHGIGSSATDGNWHTFIRDLRADLEEAQAGVTLLEVNAFLIRGSGRVYDVRLHSNYPATICEDAEDDDTDGWRIYDATPAGATIQNLWDDTRQSHVIELSGSGKANGYFLGNPDGGKWHSQSQFYIEWSMTYAEDFAIFIDVETSAGHRYMKYTPVDHDLLGSSRYIHHGLGSTAADGTWRTFTRDLRVDLDEAQPGTALLEVNAFLIRGSGRVDDVKLMSTLSSVMTYEDGEDEATTGWSIYDKNPAGATVGNVNDTFRDSRVIELVGSGKDNGYKLQTDSGKPWHNRDLFTIEWSMSYSENFTVYVAVETSAGFRYLCYSPLDKDNLGATTYVHHGLGTDATDGRWRTFVRDLQADLEDAQPGTSLLEVNGFFVRGSGLVDDIRLRRN